MTVISVKKEVNQLINSYSQLHNDNNVNTIFSFINERYNIDQEIKCEHGNNFNYFSFSRHLSTPNKQIVFLYHEGSRLMLRVTKFDPERFARSFNIYLADINKAIKSASLGFYNNKIDLFQYNMRKNFIADTLKVSIRKKYGNDIFLDMDDHIQGGPVHLVMDLTIISSEKLNSLNGILSTTHLSMRV
jgi:hypothetical protein